MRQIGTLSHENEVRKLSRFLTQQGIGNRIEVIFDAASGQMSYQVWILEEDKIGEASALFQKFEKNPTNSRYEVPDVPVETPPQSEEVAPAPHRFGTHLTHFLIALCAVVFFLNTLQENDLKKMGLSDVPLTPLMALLIFDLPPPFVELEKIVEKYEFPPKSYDAAAEMLPEIKRVQQRPYWQGVYAWAVAKLKGQPSAPGEGPLFVQIRQGEVWRFISPCILHENLLHILFNMLWLWYLGKPVEQRLGPVRTLFLSLIAGVGSNTIQYLMSGPFFIGYSGIVTALAGFIWMRERLAPWEGYPLNRATILFLLFFIGAIFALQTVSFFIQVFTSHDFAPNIANTAHIAGAIIGMFLAKSSFFAQRVKT